MLSDTRGWNQEGKNRSLNVSNLREEINCFERTGLNGPRPNIDLLPFIESKAIEGERKSTYWCMPAILNSLFFFSSPSYFLVFFFFCFSSPSFSMLTSGLCFRNSYYCDFSSPFSMHSKGFFIKSVVTGIYYFSL